MKGKLIPNTGWDEQEPEVVKSLVLADDSQTVQIVVELSFADEDVRIHSFSDGWEALEFIQTESPDIVLADVSLPGLDGYSLCHSLKEDPVLQRIPVVLLTGTLEPFDTGRADAVGCSGVLTKPFETSQLVELVKALLDEAGEEEQLPDSEAVEDDPLQLREEGQEHQRLLPVPGPPVSVEGELFVRLSAFQYRPEFQQLPRRVVFSSRGDLPILPEPEPRLSVEQTEAVIEQMMPHVRELLRKLIPEHLRTGVKSNP